MRDLPDPAWKSAGPPEETHCPECERDACEEYVIGAGYPPYLLDAVGMPDDWGCDPEHHATCKPCWAEMDQRL